MKRPLKSVRSDLPDAGGPAGRKPAASVPATRRIEEGSEEETGFLSGRAIEDPHALQAELELQNQELVDVHAKLEQEHQRYLALFEALPLPCLVLDCRGVVQLANRATVSLFGLRSAAAMQDRSVYRLLEGDAPARLHEYLRSCNTRATGVGSGPGATVLAGIVPKAREGGPAFMDAHLSPLPHISGERQGVQMLLVDRSTEVRTGRLHRIRETFHEHATTLLHAFDLDGRLLLANRSTLDHVSDPDRLAGPERAKFHGLLGSRALDYEVLVSGRPTARRSTHVTSSGDERSFLIQKFPLRDENGESFAVGGVSTDITSLIETQSALHEAFSRVTLLATRDPLTKLSNRAFFMERLEEEVLRQNREGRELMLAFIDIDGFKDINDSLGHEMGDALLCAFAGRLEDAVGDRGAVARFGGDEFLAFLVDSTPEDAENFLTQILAEIRTPYEIAGTRIIVTCSVGLSHFPKDGTTADELLRAADLALYSSKSEGRDRITHFRASFRVNSERRLKIVAALREALCRNDFRLVYQPKFDMADRTRIVGAEALLRWRDSNLGEIKPTEFVPLAELNGLNSALDLRVLKLFAAQQQAWCGAGHRLAVSVNISARSLETTDFVPTLLSLLGYYSVPPDLLLLEITETGLIRFSPDTAQQIARLTDAGVRISIDDFGTGYASLSYLQDLNPSELKIDRAFVSRVGTATGATDRIVQAIIALARSLDIQTVAEGIETEAQRKWMLDNGCSIGQGFLLSPPLERPAFEQFL